MLLSLLLVGLLGGAHVCSHPPQYTPAEQTPAYGHYGQSHGQSYYNGGEQAEEGSSSEQTSEVGEISVGGGTHHAVPQYLGCFKDHRSPRTLPLSKIVLKTTNSPQQCVHACAGFKYAGLESKDECFCGNEQPAVTEPQDHCNKHCPGDRTKTCGGHWTMDVYTVPRVPHPNIQHKGCFKDQRNPRVLPGSYGIIEHTLTPYQCANICHGYRFAGVERGQDCHCGNALPHEKLPEEKCNWKCNGDQTKFCGGNFAIDVYEIFPAQTVGSSFRRTSV